MEVEVTEMMEVMEVMEKLAPQLTTISVFTRNKNVRGGGHTPTGTPLTGTLLLPLEDDIDDEGPQTVKESLQTDIRGNLPQKSVLTFYWCNYRS